MNKENKNFRVTDPNFFLVNAVELAKKLLGKILVRDINGLIIRAKIVETEAYIGKIDRACHAHQENRSKWKAKSLNSRGGHVYVYLIYGVYYCLNIVSSVAGDPQGVLIRAVETINKNHYRSTNGPGKLCRELNIDISLNYVDLTTSNLIYLENQPELRDDQIISTARVNINYAGKDKERLWRFYIKDNLFISKK